MAEGAFFKFVSIIDFRETRKLADRLTRTGSRAVETESVMLRVVEDMMRIEREIFESDGRRGGHKWAPLKPGTVEKKGSSQILRTEGSNPRYGGTGRNVLMHSVTEPGAEYQVLHVTKNILEFGTDDPVAGIHMEGAPSRGIPARPFMEHTREDTDRWSDWFHQHLMEPFIASGDMV